MVSDAAELAAIRWQQPTPLLYCCVLNHLQGCAKGLAVTSRSEEVVDKGVSFSSSVGTWPHFSLFSSPGNDQLRSLLCVCRVWCWHPTTYGLHVSAAQCSCWGGHDSFPRIFWLCRVCLAVQGVSCGLDGGMCACLSSKTRGVGLCDAAAPLAAAVALVVVWCWSCLSSSLSCVCTHALCCCTLPD